MVSKLFDGNAHMVLPALVKELERTTHTALRFAIEKYLRPSFAKLNGAPEARTMVGECWIAFARFLLHLFVPNVPIDPAALERCSNNYWNEERSVVEIQLQIHKAFARRVDGNDRTGTIRYLEALLSEMQSPTAQDVSFLADARADISRLHMYWTEVQQFLSQVLSWRKLDAYCATAKSGDPSAPMREQVLQKSLSTFCQRLSVVYSDFADINSPLQYALLSVRLGLRLLTHASSRADNVKDTAISLHSALLAFPTIRSAELLQAYAATTSSSSASFTMVLTRLSAISFEIQLAGDIDGHLGHIQQAYDQAMGLWLIDRARAEEAERESQSLYRRKDDGNLNEAEEEEQEFLSVFPEFEDILDTDGSAPTTSRPKALVDSSSASRLFTIHQELFLAAGSEIASPNRFSDDRRSILSTCPNAEINSWPDSVDEHSLAFQTRLLHDRLSSLSGTARVSHHPYNFYFDGNVIEVKKAINILRALLQRLDTVIREWPDQMVLQHLRNRCEVVMNFSLHSPLAKVLSALEQLLSNIDDWEMYASRDNTLKSHQQAIVALVVEWRRLELSSWQGLLESQRIAFESGTSDWWFRLYDASVRGVLKIAENTHDIDGAITEFLDALAPLLDDFMTSSPLGQFTCRLKLVDSMQIYAEKLATYLRDDRTLYLHRVHTILCNTVKYYGQFEAKVIKSLSEQRKDLEKSIREFIKLASWKDVNIHALKQSAQKTHRQLYKVIRKFREVLRQPVAPLLEATTSPVADAPSTALRDLGVPAASERPFPIISEAGAQSAHLQNLDRTFRNFDVLMRERLVSFIVSHGADSAEDLAADIIAVSTSLASVSIPTNVDANRRTKLAKNLLNRKRKAWSDLLKELKRAGFSANVKPEILEKNQNRRYLREQAILPPAACKYSAAQKGEEYFHRVSGLLPQLRQALSDHHSDISTRELQRALMHIEHNFSVSLQTRSS